MRNLSIIFADPFNVVLMCVGFHNGYNLQRDQEHKQDRKRGEKQTEREVISKPMPIFLSVAIK